MKHTRFLSVLLLILLFSSCRAADVETAPTNDPAAPEKTPEVITHVYSPVECAIPADTSFLDGVTPYYDPFAGTVTLLTATRTDAEAEDGSITPAYTYTLCTFDLTGALADSAVLPIDSAAHITRGQIGEDSLWYIAETGATLPVAHIRRSDGTPLAQTILTDANGIALTFPQDPIDKLCVDGAGNLWLGNDTTVYVLDPSLAYVTEIFVADSLDALTSGNDGAVYGVVTSSGAENLVRLDGITGELSAIAALDMHTQKLAYAAYTSTDDSGYAYYLSTPDGVFGMRSGKDGAELVVDYKNSGIVNLAEGQLYGVNAGSTSLSMVCTEALMLFCKGTGAGNLPVLYRADDDIVLAEMRLIEVAHAIPLEDNIRAQLYDYDTKHRDVQVVTLDYSAYNTAENPTAGAWRLVTDITNGIISPDIVFGHSDSTEITRMVEDGRYTDLMPYFTGDAEINPNTIFGCVQNAFTDADGRLWGMTPYFILHTLLIRQDALGADHAASWTTAEFLELAARYDPPMFYLTREYAADRLSSIYGAFCDPAAGTCSFDTQLFREYLTYWKSLPAEAEYGTKSPLGQVEVTEQYRYYMDGTVPMKEFDLNTPLQMRYELGTPDTMLIGYPDAGAQLFSRMTFLVTDKAKDPALCWSFVKAFMHTEYEMWVSGPGTTALREVYKAKAYADEGKTFRVYGNGNVFEESTAAFYESIGMGDALGGGTAYTAEPWDKTTVDRAIAYLDAAGEPLTNRLPQAVYDIINEEFSAFCAGQGSADDCAGKIQSRVGIWLAERK